MILTVRSILFNIGILLFILPGPLAALQRESPHFIIYFEAVDSSAVDTVIDRLEKCYPRITADLQVVIPGKTGVHIYPSLDQFHTAIGWADASEWIVGVAWTDISIVSPLNSGPYHPYDEMVNEVIVHEFTHVCMGRINPYLPYWLGEGFPVFEGGPYPHSNHVLQFYRSHGRLPGIDELSTDYNTFTGLDGYNISFTLITYLVENYGMSSMRQFIARPSDFSIFGGHTKSEIEAGWHVYITEKYLATGIESRSPSNNSALLEIYPNPVDASGPGNVSTIRYTIPDECRVRLSIVDISGREVATLVDTRQNPGTYEAPFRTATLSSGVYFSRLTAGTVRLTKKILITR